MIQNTANRPLSELLSADNKITYHIPRYQREYVWSKWNWEALFDDIEESEGSHFLGSIICINTQSDTSLPASLELVDGQQRMTTITLLYLALYDYLAEFNPDPEGMAAKMELYLLENRLVLRDKDLTRLSPSLANHNLEDYRFLFSSVSKEIRQPKPKNLGNRRLRKAFVYFADRLRAEVDGTPIFNFASAKKYLERLNSATLVKIDVATHADAFTLFETLNNRGVPLSAIDLIKNKLLGELERKDGPGALDKNFQRWNRLLYNLTDDYKTQERFLRQFYNAFRLEEDIAVEKVNKALRSNLIRVYETLIDRDVNGVFDRIEEASEIYAGHLQYDNEEYSNELGRALRNLDNVGGADTYMLLLYVVKRFGVSEEEKIRLINLLCRYTIRRNVTDSPPTRDLTNYFMDMIEDLNALPAYDYDTVKAIIVTRGRPAADEVFQEKLSGDLYEENVGATRYVLSAIELADTQTKERYVDFYARNKKLFVWTVEHILPQGENIPADWVTMIAKGDRKVAEQVRKEYVHKLGNLTLTGYNSQLSNFSLDRKQDRKKDDKYVGYKNGLNLNEDIASVTTWTKEQIEDRTHKLVARALEIFKL
jgi:uncharacterized protein with ParB-like and HNH nuclease domain